MTFLITNPDLSMVYFRALTGMIETSSRTKDSYQLTRSELFLIGPKPSGSQDRNVKCYSV